MNKAILVLALLLPLMIPVSVYAQVYECNKLTYSGVQKTACIYCINEFVNRLYNGEFRDLASNYVVYDQNEYVMYVTYKNTTVNITMKYHYATGWSIISVSNVTELLWIIHDIDIELIKRDKTYP